MGCTPVFQFVPRILQFCGEQAGAGIPDRITWWLSVATWCGVLLWLETAPATAPEMANARTDRLTSIFMTKLLDVNNPKVDSLRTKV